MRGWDVWLSVLLLAAGSACLFVSTAAPFTPVRQQFMEIIHYLEFGLLCLVAAAILWMLAKSRFRFFARKPERYCNRCGNSQEPDWRYCPQCGLSVHSSGIRSG